ncbi:MAG: 2Fe-2S iron-sulfur cluster-binding protein, partial [Myxococcota bacterium]
MSRDPIEITFTLDGAAQTITVDPARSVLSLLREDFGCHQLAAGCSPQGICGSCLAIVNGKPRVTCTMRAKTLNNKRLETLRSLSDVETRALQQAFIAEGAVQCGYCMPGILNQAAFLLRHERHPGDDLINQGLNLHLCRCTGYGAIRRAIRRAGDILDAEAPPAPPETILDAESRASLFGDLPRIDDIDRPGVVYMALRFAPKAGSQIDRIDFSEAEMVDGVVAILTADAIPGAQVVDGRPLLVPVGAVARSAADVVAVVGAETGAAARGAASGRVLGVPGGGGGA